MRMLQLTHTCLYLLRWYGENVFVLEFVEQWHLKLTQCSENDFTVTLTAKHLNDKILHWCFSFVAWNSVPNTAKIIWHRKCPDLQSIEAETVQWDSLTHPSTMIMHPLACISIALIWVTSQEKRIYDLKKKNQELEKFKFVLDYKIKELKKQIEPRENEIKAMNEQIQEVSQKRLLLQQFFWKACYALCWPHCRWNRSWSVSTRETKVWTWRTRNCCRSWKQPTKKCTQRDNE